MAKEYGELYGWGGKDEEWVLRTSSEAGINLPLTDKDGNDRRWRSQLEALNKLAAEGWELEATTSQSEADHPERIFSRFILARERPASGEGAFMFNALTGERITS